MDPRLLQWLDEADDSIFDKLVAVGLAEERSNSRLQSFIESYIAYRTDLKPRTVIKFNATKEYLIEHFGSDRDLRKLNEADGDSFRVFLLSKKNSKGKSMAENTVRKHTQIAKQFFNYAIKQKLIRDNPLKTLASTVTANPERMHYITHEDAKAVLDSCPDSQWRLIFALARYQALRCPSEILSLTWNDIDWKKMEIFVRSEKTEHHVGGGSRKIPIFSDLVPYLEDAHEASRSRLRWRKTEALGALLANRLCCECHG